MNKSKKWATGLLLAVFAAGLIVGSAASALADLRSGKERQPRHSYTERLQEKLGLSQEQRTTVESILDARRAAIHQIWEEVGPRYEAIRQETRAEITDILDDDQRVTYGEMIARSDSIRAARAQKRRTK